MHFFAFHLIALVEPQSGTGSPISSGFLQQLDFLCCSVAQENLRHITLYSAMLDSFRKLACSGFCVAVLCSGHP